MATKVDLSALNRDAREPLHRQLSGLLRQAIHAGVYQTGERIESERVFIETGGLSYPTVARAFRDLAKEGLVHRRIGSGTFVAEAPLPTGTGLETVGMLYYSVHTAGSDALYAGLEAECRPRGIDLITLPSGLDAESESRALHQLEKRKVDGLIVLPVGLPSIQGELRRLRSRGMMMVTLGVRLPQVQCDAVTFHNEHGAMLATRHLLDLGHRHIGFLGTSLKYPNTTHLEILSGMRQAYEQTSLAMDERLQVLLPLSFHEEDPQIRQRALSLIHPEHAEPATAVLCGSDAMARLMANVLRDEGLRVPQDVSLVSFGDLPLASQLDPALTAVSWAFPRMAREAVRRLLAQSVAPETQPVHVILDTNLVVRRSTTQPPARIGKPDRPSNTAHA